jgi:hypothetical protein
MRRRNTPDFLTTYQRIDSIGKAGDPLPPFEDHMIRQRIDENGTIYPLGPAGIFFSLRLKPNDIGVVKEAPVRRWRERQQKWDRLHLKLHGQVIKERRKLEEPGLVKGMEGENPPPTALVRRWLGEQKRDGRLKLVDELRKKPFGVGLSWWSGWGSKHDRQEVRSTPLLITIRMRLTGALDRAAPRVRVRRGGQYPAPRERVVVKAAEHSHAQPQQERGRLRAGGPAGHEKQAALAGAAARGAAGRGVGFAAGSRRGQQWEG